jgi:glycosyltransferase involved in cell wall biosynthesis
MKPNADLVLIYDGDCQFCRLSLDFGLRILKNFPLYVAFQRINPKEFGLTLEQVKSQAPRNTKVLGWTDASKLFAASDIILSTSENEGMPIALIEAQLASKPVVATKVGGVAEVVINNKTGFVTGKNTEELAKALKKLIDSKALRTTQGRAAKAHALGAFSVEKMIEAHVSLYKKLTK